jgi:hypothetical protein
MQRNSDLNLRPALSAFIRLAENPFIALFLSAVYPAVFLLSLNWYQLTNEKIALILLLPSMLALTVYLLIRATIRLCFHAQREPRKHSLSRSDAIPLMIALACSTLFFFFMFGTLQILLVHELFILLCFAALSAFLVALAMNRRLVYWTTFLSIMTVTSLIAWIQSVIAATTERAAEQLRASANPPFQELKFKRKPNIYLIIYDAYGNERLYSEVFGIDNAEIHRELVSRQFKVLNTYSNYWATWETMLAVFLADHHYYDLSVGYDSRIGPSIMNGTTFNAVHSVLKNNGYKVQYIESSAYLVKYQGNLDYLYSGEEPVYTGWRLFSNPILDLLPSVRPKSREGYAVNLTEILFKRLDEAAGSSNHFFTYIHLPLPGHASSIRSWRDLKDYEQAYREFTSQANALMPRTIDRILEIDPNALIVIMGDHGSWRYNKAWNRESDPNDGFRTNGLDSNIVTLDLFGILLAVRSGGQCDQFIYDTLTPVNLMRVLFSCLTGDEKLIDRRAPDISIFSDTFSRGYGLYMAVDNGKILKPWIKIERR